MTLILKDPAALLDYAVDWGADYLTNDTIDTSAWTIDPAEAGGDYGQQQRDRADGGAGVGGS